MAGVEVGRKDDGSKPDYTFLPLRHMDGIVRVFEFGAQKYSRNNFYKVPDYRRRYLSAALRHIAEDLDRLEDGLPPTVDQESGQLAIEHAAASLIMVCATYRKSTRESEE